jgi:uncharacterized membrane protein YqjE
MTSEVLFNAVGHAGSAARVQLAAILHRSELAALEAGEACDHLLGSLALVLGAAVLALLGGFAATLTFAALVWAHEDRAQLIGLLTLAYLLGAGGLAWFTLHRLRTWRPLAETRTQLRADHDCLGELLSSNGPSSSSP